ncbi:hypothetical protein Dimus_004825 [Dionaea muscipula]
MHGEAALPELGPMHGDAALPELDHVHGEEAPPELDHMHGEEALPELGHVHGEEAPPELGDTCSWWRSSALWELGVNPPPMLGLLLLLRARQWLTFSVGLRTAGMHAPCAAEFGLLSCSSVQQGAEVRGLVGAWRHHARLLPDALLRSAFFHGRSTLSSPRMGEEGNSSSTSMLAPPQARPLARRPELGDILIFGLLILVFTLGKKKGSRPSSMHGLGLRVSP